MMLQSGLATRESTLMTLSANLTKIMECSPAAVHGEHEVFDTVSLKG